MSILDPLRRFMCLQRAEIMEMTFPEIEKIIGNSLPKGAAKPRWWSGPASDGHDDAWKKAGYSAKLIDKDTVRFEKIAPLFDR